MSLSPIAQLAREIELAEEIPDAPPSEVLEAIAAAADAYDRLAARGRHLHFAVDPSTGRLAVQVLGADGRCVGTVSPRQVLDLANGEPLP